MEEENNTIAKLVKSYDQYNLLQIRLDTSDILKKIEMFLTSEIEIIKQNDKGEYIREVIKVGEPKANRKGIASILNWMQLTINPHVVQGNFPIDRGGQSVKYDSFIYDFQIDLMDELMINIYNYGINEDELQGIVDAIMKLIIAFMTRLIGNKERDSYGQTFKEINTTQTGNKGIPLFNKK